MGNKKKWILFTFLFFLGSLAQATPDSFVYEGYLTNGGSAVTDASATLRVQIKIPGNATCILYQKDVSAVNVQAGYFAVRIDSNPDAWFDNGGGNSSSKFRRVFQEGTFSSNATCAGGGTATANQTRELYITYMSGTNPVFGPISLESVPFASVASVAESLYPSADVNFNGQKITGLGTPTAIGDAATKAYVDTAATNAANASNLSSGTIPAARLPAATGAALGGVQQGSNVTIDVMGVISITSSNVTSALGFTPVDKSGDTMTGSLTMGTNSVLFNGAGTRVHSPAANQLQFSTNSTPQMTIDSLGRVGIGTSSPTDPLDIQGTFNGMFTANIRNLDSTGSSFYRASNNSTGVAFFGVTGTTYGGSGIYEFNSASLYINNQLNSLNIGTEGAQPFRVFTSNAERIRVAPNGNVGIGTTNPTYKLDVSGTTRLSGSLDMASNVINGVAAPTNATDAANKAYVDTATGGGYQSQFQVFDDFFAFDGTSITNSFKRVSLGVGYSSTAASVDYITPGAGDQNKVGVVRLATTSAGAFYSGVTYCQMDTVGNIPATSSLFTNSGGGTLTYEILLKPNTYSVGAVIKAGFLQYANTTANLHGAWIEGTGNIATVTWAGKSGNGSVTTHNAFLGTTTTTNWAKLKIELDNTSAKYYLNGTLIGTYMTSIPAAAQGLCPTVVVSTGIAQIDVDYVLVRKTFSTNR